MRSSRSATLRALILLGALWSVAGYSAYQSQSQTQGGGGGGGYSSSYSSSSSSSSSSSYGGGGAGGGGTMSGALIGGGGAASGGRTQVCCQLNGWAQSHMNEVREFANRLRQEYNNLSRGHTSGYVSPWHENLIDVSGKTSSELDAISRRVSEQMLNDMRAGQVTYTTITQPNYFEWKASQALNNFAQADFLGQQQQQQQEDHFIGGRNQFQQSNSDDLTHYDEVNQYAYPAEHKVIDGKTYVVHKNFTEAKKTSGDGSLANPLITVYKRNHTAIITGQPGVGAYNAANSLQAGSSQAGHQQQLATNFYRPMTSGGSTVTSSSQNTKKTIYDWANQNMEPGVVGYRPVVTLGNEWATNVGNAMNMNMNVYNQNPVVIPVDGGGSNSQVETFARGSTSGFQWPRPMGGYAPGPGSTLTVSRFNKTITTNADGTHVTGSESNKKWVNGVLVYDSEQPFSEGTAGVATAGRQNQAWQNEERERFFWFFGGAETAAQCNQRLEEWQHQQEERLLALAQRYHTSLEEICSWHRTELERFRALQQQYQTQAQASDATLKAWQRQERGRLDWLIHQNSVTREDLARWQRENHERLVQLAQQYRISVEELKAWQVQELNRMYEVFNAQNDSMLTRPIDSGSLHAVSTDEQARLDELIRQHNATIAQLQDSIRLDQQKLADLSVKYQGNVHDMEKWLQSELARLTAVITEQRNEMARITEWQRSERSRLESLVKSHQGSVQSLESQMAFDRSHIQELASKYHVSIEELEKWQQAELLRLQQQGQSTFEMSLKEWQRREHENLMKIVQQNDLTIDEFQTQIIQDRTRLENLARTYKVQVSEVEEWIRKELKNFQSQGLLKEVEKELAIWQQKERERLMAILRQNEVTVGELQLKITNDQTHLQTLANNYHVQVEEVEEWLKKELLRLQSQGLIKVEDLKDWQQQERADILKLVQQNRLTIDEFEKKLLQDRKRLAAISQTYNVQMTEVEEWIKKEGERLQNLGLLQMQEQLNNWQKIEHDRLLQLISTNHLSLTELEQKIKNDQTHLQTVANQHRVRVEEIEEWIKQEIKKLQQQGLIEMEQMKDWQTEWRGNLTAMVKERDFTAEQFHKWLLEDRARLQSLAMQHNVQIEEMEQWLNNEEQHFISMGLLKPNEKLTDWQEIERRYLERITQEHYHSTEQLEERLRQDRLLLEKLARDHRVQVEEIETWMKKELSRLRDEGSLQIENLTSWQIAERDRLEALTKADKQWSAEEIEAVLRQDREHMQKMAFQYHTSIEEIEKWIQSEVERLRVQGKLDIAKLTEWQKAEQQRILNLLQQQSHITMEEFERKVQKDRHFVSNLAQQHHISVVEVEEYVKKVIDDLRNKGQFAVENLQQWQHVERDYIKQLLAQYDNSLTTAEFEQKLLADRLHLQQLAAQYRVSTENIEKWMIEELKRLRQHSEQQVNQMAEWQRQEVQRLKDLLRQNSHLSYVDFEVELLNEQARLQELATQYSISVEEVEKWLRQQLLNLKSSGQIQMESLTVWQEAEQKRLVDMLLQQKQQITHDQFEAQLRRDHARLVELAQQHQVSVEQIERWMREELQRLKSSGLLQVEQLTKWQTEERARLQDWLNQQNNKTTFEEFQAFLKHDGEQLNRIAQDYQVTVEEIESWVQQEAARLQLLGFVNRPENLVWTEEQTWNWNSGKDSNSGGSHNAAWKEHTAAHLQAMAEVRHMNWDDFERYLKEERSRWQQYARQHVISVEEIETWLRQKAENLVHQGIIQGPVGGKGFSIMVVDEEWHLEERQHIQKMLNDMLRQHQQLWSIEELERQLKNDIEHLQRLAVQHHITIEHIISWYQEELQRLLAQRKINSENLSDWQQREKSRIYYHVIRQPSMTLQSLEQQLLSDRTTLSSLADEYHIMIVELEQFIRQELRRLATLGLIRDGNGGGDSSRWQEEERERLHTIAADITITEEELLEFMAVDNKFQQHLTQLYGITLSELAPFQRIEINKMERQSLLDRTELPLFHMLQSWQKQERDRFYQFIKNHNFTKKDLMKMQRNELQLSDYAQRYGIDVQTLKDWQMQELQRLLAIAEHYRMSLHDLQDFRDKELRYIYYVLHKKTSSEDERIQWGSTEARRMEVLGRQTGLSGEDLLAWRRRLYLLCQGYIALDVDGRGGHDTGRGTTGVTGTTPAAFSKDRGDQPPNVYNENMDGNEPGLEGEEEAIFPMPPAQLKVEPTTPTPQYLPPVRHPAGGGTVQSGYRYTKKEYKYSGPMGMASASAAVDSSTSMASANAQHMGYAGLRRGQRDDQQQQQQQEETDDFGQQQEVDLGWHSQDMKDGGQQQQQVEESSHFAGGSSSHHSSGAAGGRVAGGATNSGYSSSHASSASSSSSSGSRQAGYVAGGAARQGQQHTQQQQQQEDFGQQQQEELGFDLGQQQQVELGDYRQKDIGQQQEQVEVEDLTGTFTTKKRPTGPSEKQLASTGGVEVQAESADAPTGFWGKLKEKTTNIFG